MAPSAYWGIQASNNKNGHAKSNLIAGSRDGPSNYETTATYLDNRMMCSSLVSKACLQSMHAVLFGTLGGLMGALAFRDACEHNIISAGTRLHNDLVDNLHEIQGIG